MATDLTSLIATVKANVKATAQKSLDLSVPVDVMVSNNTQEFTFGTAANQIDQEFHDKRTLAAQTNEDLDFSGDLTNSLGGVVTFSKIKAIIIVNKSSAADLEISPAAVNGCDLWFGDASDKFTLMPGGLFLITEPATGWAITADTADLLNISNPTAGESLDYDIVILGLSA